jgi:hypothetical protein
MKTITCECVARAALGTPLHTRAGELIYRCAHPERHRNGDAHPSLSINIHKDVFICGPCGVSGKAWQLAAFIADLEPGDKHNLVGWLKKNGLLNGTPKSAKQVKSDPVAIYEYRDSDGNPVARKLRFEPGRDGRKKDFSWQHWEAGGWVDGLSSVEPSLYRLPEIKDEASIILVEGEKDADCGAAIGLPTTTTGGCNSWRPRYSEFLKGKRVAIIADADEPGRKHARRIAESLHGKVESLKVLELSGAKDLAMWVEGGGTRDALTNVLQGILEWKPQSIDGAELLTEVYEFVRRFSVLSEAQATVISLWVLHTHAIDAADSTPYLAITSAEKQCGKSRLLEVLQTIVENPWFTGRVTAAVLVRKIDAKRPTLLLDESDAAFGSEKEYAEALRGILNTGHRRGGVASLCVGKGAEITFKDFSTFGPKAIAGIGKLPDTVADRSIPIRLKRAAPGEIMERFRLRNVTPEAEALRGGIQMWCDSVMEILRDARPALPDQLSDRQQDGAEPLLAIADAAGKGWPEIARMAIVDVCAENQVANDSVGVRLLADIRQVFETHDGEKISSKSLVEALATLETSPWAEWSQGKPLSAPKLAKLLRPFDIAPRTIRIGDATIKGYDLADFEDPFRRYLRLPAPSVGPSVAPNSSQPSQTNTGLGFL